MSNVRYLDYQFEQGLKSPNYANGRLLFAEDLQTDQDAIRTRLAQLGQSVGHGVLDGLWVTKTANSTNSLDVSAGIGINPLGHIVELLEDKATLSLVITAEGLTLPANAGNFQNCEVAVPGTNASITTGAYLLAACPVSRAEGSVPINQSGSQGNTSACVSRWEVEGIEFKAIRLVDFGNNGVAGGNSQTIRNRLAHWCFGIQPLAVFPRADFGGQYNGLDRISSDDLTPCDLPLAVFYWDDGQVRFVDNWSARRRLIAEYVAPSWRGYFGAQRAAEMEARLQQFQAQINILFASANRDNVRARDYFELMPPMGYVPLHPSNNVIRTVAKMLCNIVYTRGATYDVDGFPFPFIEATGMESLADALDQINTILAELLIDSMSNSPRAGFIGDTFWSGVDVGTIRLVDLERTDVQQRYLGFANPLHLNRQPEIELYFILEYMFQYLSSVLLQTDVMIPGAQSPELDTLLEGLHYYTSLLWSGGSFTQSFQLLPIEPDALLIESVARYLGMPDDELEENLERSDLAYALYIKEFANLAIESGEGGHVFGRDNIADNTGEVATEAPPPPAGTAPNQPGFVAVGPSAEATFTEAEPSTPVGVRPELLLTDDVMAELTVRARERTIRRFTNG